jgi:hypothetical protein
MVHEIYSVKKFLKAFGYPGIPFPKGEKKSQG